MPLGARLEHCCRDSSRLRRYQKQRRRPFPLRNRQASHAMAQPCPAADDEGAALRQSIQMLRSGREGGFANRAGLCYEGLPALCAPPLPLRAV
jgi:hypothetical protein